MTEASLSQPASFPAWAVRRALWFLLAINLPYILFPPLNVVINLRLSSEAPVAELALFTAGGLAAGAIQLRHSLAAARGRKPRGWPLTLAALIAICIVPSFWFAPFWVETCWFVIASVLMLLPGWLARVTALAVLALASALYEQTIPGFALWRFAVHVQYILVVLALGGCALYGSARLVAILSEVFAARTQLAEQSLGRERLRLARDLHDLLGQGLSAVSLKGDLALALLAADPAAAEHEIQSLTAVARSALRDMRAVTRDEHDVSLRAEVDSATAVLRAAGLIVQTDDAMPVLSPARDTVLAWAVREGATNILRHSQATEGRITTTRAAGIIRLDITNNGARPSTTQPSAVEPGESTGLAGLAERARALGGTVAGEYASAGTFRLRVELPEETS